jgi:hypothetical protein
MPWLGGPLSVLIVIAGGESTEEDNFQTFETCTAVPETLQSTYAIGTAMERSDFEIHIKYVLNPSDLVSLVAKLFKPKYGVSSAWSLFPKG